MALFAVDHQVGSTLVVVSCASMAAASVVLATSDRSKVRPAAIQGILPSLALLALAIWAIS